MFAFFVVIHVLICVALILIVLLQAGRGGGLAGAFGAGTAQTIFGGRGAATFLSKATAWLATGFMVMAILLAVLSSRSGGGGGGLLQQRARERANQAQLPPSTSTLNPATSGDTSGALFPEAAPGTTTPGQQPAKPPAPAPTPPGGQPQH